tara:strand:+ start:3146 stop:3790 length:645 start_codon:yes stop_codon:yes gene_type:complete
MCGRFVNTNKIEDINTFFNIEYNLANDMSLPISYNISPSQYSPIIIEENKLKKIEMMYWGLIPSWSKDKKFSTNMINARIESIKEKPSYKNLIHTSRCIVIASGYYEWTKIKSKKQPHYITNDKNLLPIAGLWTKWNDISSFTIITKNADSNLSSIHHRMPLVIDDRAINTYLNRDIPFDQSYNISKSELIYHKVSTMVNSSVYNDRSCIRSID